MRVIDAFKAATDLSPESAANKLGRGGFRPDFTHQLFDEERLEGYEDGDVTIQLLYTATSLHWLVKVQTSDNDTTRYHILEYRAQKVLVSASVSLTNRQRLCIRTLLCTVNPFSSGVPTKRRSGGKGVINILRGRSASLWSSWVHNLSVLPRDSLSIFFCPVCVFSCVSPVTPPPP